MPNIKFIGGCSIFAFVISLFSGIIGGVGFFTILLRAVIGAVLFGLLGGGIVMFLERMIPELFALEGAEEAEIEEPGEAETGGNVDITLDEDQENSSFSPDSTGGEEKTADGFGSSESVEEADSEEDEFVEEMAEDEEGETG
ncbi:MAG: hypothetical protein R6V67_02800, partial [Spirochaetia bacterium]